MRGEKTEDRSQKSEARSAAIVGIAAVLGLWGWQALTVHYNYGGNWTALYLIGPRTPVPPAIAGEKLYIFPNNSGYDGQSFHLMAHDPWMRRSTAEQLEIMPFRYARILVPALAWCFALGRDRWIDPAYFAVILFFAFCGAYWMALYAERASRRAVWGLAFVLSPATLTSIDRMTVDIALAALCAGFVLYTDRGETRKVAVVLTCALLTRETAWVLFAAYELFLFARRRWAELLLMAMTAIPAIAWGGYVAARAGEAPIPPHVLGWIPLAGFFDRLTHAAYYDLPAGLRALAISFDYVALIGIGLAVAIAVVAVRREAWSPRSAAICAFALAVIFLRGPTEWQDAYAFGRIFAPLLLLMAMDYGRMWPGRAWVGLTPTLLVDSRIVLNLGKQAVGIAKGLLG